MRLGIIVASIILFAAAADTTLAAPVAQTIAEDGTLDLAEMEAAAAAAFDKLNTDSDTTLDYDEAKGRLSKNTFLAADPDADKTLSKQEYVEMAEKLFNAADSNNDGVLDAKELRSRAAQALMRLLQ